MKKIILIIIASILTFTVNLNAQEDEDLEIFDDELWDDSEASVNFFSDIPVIEIVYGMETPTIYKDVFNSDFNKPSSLEGRFGYMDFDKNLYKTSVFGIDGNFLFVSYMTNELNLNKDNVEDRKFSVDVWNIGFSNFEGYGWEFSENTNLQLYIKGSLVWSGVDSKDSLLDKNDFKRISRIGDGVRFGDSYESGIKFQVYKPVTLIAGYQRHLIYPRVLFWKWAGSKIVQGIGDALVNMFNDDIMEATPNFGPIVYFILNTAYNYGWYELSKANMNFPFSTEEPMIIDGFKFGFNITF